MKQLSLTGLAGLRSDAREQSFGFVDLHGLSIVSKYRLTAKFRLHRHRSRFSVAETDDGPFSTPSPLSRSTVASTSLHRL